MGNHSCPMLRHLSSPLTVIVHGFVLERECLRANVRRLFGGAPFGVVQESHLCSPTLIVDANTGQRQQPSTTSQAFRRLHEAALALPHHQLPQLQAIIHLAKGEWQHHGPLYSNSAS